MPPVRFAALMCEPPTHGQRSPRGEEPYCWASIPTAVLDATPCGVPGEGGLGGAGWARECGEKLAGPMSSAAAAGAAGAGGDDNAAAAWCERVGLGRGRCTAGGLAAVRLLLPSARE